MNTYRISCTIELDVFVEADTPEDALLWHVTRVITSDDDNHRAGVRDVEIGRVDVVETTKEV